MANTNPARGMRDFLPSDVRKREYVIGIIKEVYESYGFEPLETPAVENLETLTGKYGEEGNQLIFKILKRGEKLQEELSAGEITSERDLSDLALRYDLTVPLARVAANRRNDLPKFFKRYQIQPVWRADRPARGRFREFYQCDVDAIGSNSMLVEAELISAVCAILEKLGFEEFTIRINHRKFLQEILDAVGIPEEKQIEALTALDKLDKIGQEGVSREFLQRGVNETSSEKLILFFESLIESNVRSVLGTSATKKIVALQKKILEREGELATEMERANKKYNLSVQFINEAQKDINSLKEKMLETDAEKIWERINNIAVLIKQKKQLDTFTKNLDIMSVVLGFLVENTGDKDYDSKSIDEIVSIIENTISAGTSDKILVDPSLARGLSYYTGAIFEINVPDLAGSLGGGGRYDGLIGTFGKEQIPACGFSLGLERILVVMEERGMFPKELTDTAADVMVTVWNEDAIGESLKLANQIREESKAASTDGKGLRVLVYPEADKLGKQFKYADSIKVPFVCVLGETEIAENKVTLKNLRTGEQETVSRDEIAEKIK